MGKRKNKKWKNRKNATTKEYTKLAASLAIAKEMKETFSEEELAETVKILKQYRDDPNSIGVDTDSIHKKESEETK